MWEKMATMTVGSKRRIEAPAENNGAHCLAAWLRLIRQVGPRADRTSFSNSHRHLAALEPSSRTYPQHVLDEPTAYCFHGHQHWRDACGAYQDGAFQRYRAQVSMLFIRHALQLLKEIQNCRKLPPTVHRRAQVPVTNSCFDPALMHRAE